MYENMNIQVKMNISIYNNTHTDKQKKFFTSPATKSRKMGQNARKNYYLMQMKIHFFHNNSYIA